MKNWTGQKNPAFKSGLYVKRNVIFMNTIFIPPSRKESGGTIFFFQDNIENLIFKNDADKCRSFSY